MYVYMKCLDKIANRSHLNLPNLLELLSMLNPIHSSSPEILRTSLGELSGIQDVFVFEHILTKCSEKGRQKNQILSPPKNDETNSLYLDKSMCTVDSIQHMFSVYKQVLCWLVLLSSVASSH